MAEREVRYCTTEDGVRIAYCVESEGPPLLITPYLGESFSQLHLFPAFAEFMEAVAKGHTAIRFDHRGTGASQRTAVDLTRDGWIGDLEAIVDATGLSRIAIFASGSGTLSAIDFANRHPERVSRLVLYGCGPGPRYVWTREIMKSMGDLARANWPMAARAFADQSLRDVDPAMAAQQADLMLQSQSGEEFAATFAAVYDYDVSSVLAELTVPTLLIHRVDDAVAPFRLAQEMASQIKDARLVPVPGKANQPAGGDTRPMLEAIHRFLDEDPETRALPTAAAAIHTPENAFRAVLFTDLVGHTEMMQRLGDGRGRDVLREHERITREVLKGNGGTEVKTMGDGFMASFGSVTKAVECAIALQRAFADREGEPLNVRVGLNAGEPIEEDGDLFGATVILASRIAAKAEGGEILVADTVRGLCSGKGFLFADRGEFVAKGIEEPVRISEVNWRSRESESWEQKEAM